MYFKELKIHFKLDKKTKLYVFKSERNMLMSLRIESAKSTQSSTSNHYSNTDTSSTIKQVTNETELSFFQDFEITNRIANMRAMTRDRAYHLMQSAYNGEDAINKEAESKKRADEIAKRRKKLKEYSQQFEKKFYENGFNSDIEIAHKDIDHMIKKSGLTHDDLKGIQIDLDF